MHVSAYYYPVKAAYNSVLYFFFFSSGSATLHIPTSSFDDIHDFGSRSDDALEQARAEADYWRMVANSSSQQDESEISKVSWVFFKRTSGWNQFRHETWVVLAAVLGGAIIFRVFCHSQQTKLSIMIRWPMFIGRHFGAIVFAHWLVSLLHFVNTPCVYG